jgi:DNA-binding transcriptional regulator YhcF (GntR family)
MTRPDECGVIAVEWDHEDPIYVQIARQIRTRIAAGELRPGTALPAVRTLASDLGLNLNTVARAYRLLEKERFVTIRNRSGAEVASPAPGADAGSRARLARQLREMLARMRQSGIAAGDLRRIVEREIAALGGREGRPRQAAGRSES